MDYKRFCLVWCVFNIYSEIVTGLSLLQVRIDKHTIRGNRTILECRFDLQGETLYSVKWYKDGHEFYRFVPRDTPPAQLFPLPGVHVKLEHSNESQVTLESLELSSSGRYRCEVSAEAPSFQTVSDHGDMLTVALPEEGPRIYGGKPRYQAGDTVRVNCTSGRSKPAAQLTWYINGEIANGSYLKGPILKYEGREGLVKTTLGLEFRVERRHFREGDLKLKCLASIATVYWNSNEESVERDRPQRPPVMEVKDNQPHSSSAESIVDGRNLCHVSTMVITACAVLLTCHR
ncbi:cell adhesion molecule 2-like isoform X2 [Rhodnius prolixus]|uniref:cell adhesion molecule 2-like isoform X2 n=1 Tax=Rhodnius prolixus TaxID=13249 RepID=UPI003D18F452